MSSYHNVRQRVKVLSNNLESLIMRNEELEKANKRLRLELETSASREHARDRVLQSIS